jgi:hypothetical protein
MKKFKDFNITPKVNLFVGEKISIKKLFNQPIRILDHKLEPSKQKEGTECLTLQIEKGDEKRVVFTGSKVLIDIIKQLPKDAYPFETTIKGDNDYFEFT